MEGSSKSIIVPKQTEMQADKISLVPKEQLVSSKSETQSTSNVKLVPKQVIAQLSSNVISSKPSILETIITEPRMTEIQGSGCLKLVPTKKVQAQTEPSRIKYAALGTTVTTSKPQEAVIPSKVVRSIVPGTEMSYKTPGARRVNKNGHVKRPMNAFMCWARDARQQVISQMPHSSNADISITLGKIWNELPMEKKEKYFNEAEMIKTQHRQENPGWTYRPRPKKRRIEHGPKKPSLYQQWKVDQEKKKAAENKKLLESYQAQATISCNQQGIPVGTNIHFYQPTQYIPQTIPHRITAQTMIRPIMPGTNSQQRLVRPLRPVVVPNRFGRPLPERFPYQVVNQPSEVLIESITPKQALSEENPPLVHVLQTPTTMNVNSSIRKNTAQPMQYTLVNEINGSTSNINQHLISPKGRPPSLSKRTTVSCTKNCPTKVYLTSDELDSVHESDTQPMKARIINIAPVEQEEKDVDDPQSAENESHENDSSGVMQHGVKTINQQHLKPVVVGPVKVQQAVNMNQVQLRPVLDSTDIKTSQYTQNIQLQPATENVIFQNTIPRMSVQNFIHKSNCSTTLLNNNNKVFGFSKPRMQGTVLASNNQRAYKFLMPVSTTNNNDQFKILNTCQLQNNIKTCNVLPSPGTGSYTIQTPAGTVNNLSVLSNNVIQMKETGNKIQAVTTDATNHQREVTTHLQPFETSDNIIQISNSQQVTENLTIPVGTSTNQLTTSVVNKKNEPVSIINKEPVTIVKRLNMMNDKKITSDNETNVTEIAINSVAPYMETDENCVITESKTQGLLSTVESTAQVGIQTKTDTTNIIVYASPNTQQDNQITVALAEPKSNIAVESAQVEVDKPEMNSAIVEDPATVNTQNILINDQIVSFVPQQNVRHENNINSFQEEQSCPLDLSMPKSNPKINIMEFPDQEANFTLNMSIVSEDQSTDDESRLIINMSTEENILTKETKTAVMEENDNDPNHSEILAAGDSEMTCMNSQVMNSPQNKSCNNIKNQNTSALAVTLSKNEPMLFPRTTCSASMNIRTVSRSITSEAQTVMGDQLVVQGNSVLPFTLYPHQEQMKNEGVLANSKGGRFHSMNNVAEQDVEELQGTTSDHDEDIPRHFPFHPNYMVSSGWWRTSPDDNNNVPQLDLHRWMQYMNDISPPNVTVDMRAEYDKFRAFRQMQPCVLKYSKPKHMGKLE